MCCVQRCSGSMLMLQSKDVGSAVDLAVLMVHVQSLLPAQHQPPAAGSSGGSSSGSEGDPSHTGSASGSASVPTPAELLERVMGPFLEPGAAAKWESAWRT
jgi:hypothetical protein